MKRFKRVLSLALVLALLVPSFGFASSFYERKAPEGLEELSPEELQRYEELVSRINDLVKVGKRRAQVEFDKRPDEFVRIIVELQDRPAIAYATDRGIAYSQLSAGEQSSIESKIYKAHEEVKSLIKARNIDMGYLRNFSVAFNGFSGIVKYEDMAEIENIPGVKKVYISQEYYRPILPDLGSSHEQIGRNQAWDIGYKGEGMVIAIIDSGVDPNHKDFVLTDEDKARLKEEDIVNVPGKYFTAKVPYGYNYYDLNDEILDLGPNASEHGMHVAGISAANGNPEEGGVQGVAPEAQVLAMKVFSNDPKYATTFDDIYLNAIDDAIKLKANVLNMSLGATAGFVEKESAINIAITNAVENGIVPSISAGNSAQFGDGWDLPWKENPDIGVVGTPGISTDSLQVASVENDGMEVAYLTYETEGVAEPLPTPSVIVNNEAFNTTFLNNDLESIIKLSNAVNRGEVVYIKISSTTLLDIKGNILTEIPEDLPKVVTYYDHDGNTSLRASMGQGGTGEPEEVKVPMIVASPKNPSDVFKHAVEYVDCGFGLLEDFAGKNLQNKFAIVQRGENPFTEKIMNAQNAGARGIIVYNHAAGGDALINMAYEGNIFAAFIGHADGIALLEREENTVRFPKGTITVPNPDAGYMSDFSSWGTTPDLQLKPEITAPGGMIYSTLQNDKYGTMSGTSMSAPQVAGGSALVMEYLENHDLYKELSKEEKSRLAKVLLMNTANILENPNSGTPYSPRKQGAGVMNLADATTTLTRVVNNANGLAKVELKELEDTSFEFDLKVINDSDKDIEYKIDIDVLADKIIADKEGQEYISLDSRRVKFTSDTPDTITVASGEEEVFTVKVDFSEDEDIYRNMFIEGFVTLKDTTDSSPKLSVPYVGFYGDWSEPSVLDGMNYIDEKSYYGFAGMIDADMYYYEKISMSPGTWWGFLFGTDTLIPVLSFMRNAEEIKYNILDEDGNKLRTLDIDEYVRKHYFDGGRQGNPYSLTLDRIWDGTVKGKVVEDGLYYYEIKSKLNFDGGEQVVRYPIYIDTEEPVVEDVKYDTETNILSFKVTDGEKSSGLLAFDIYLNGESLFVAIGEEEIAELLVEGTEDKYEIPIDIDLTESGEYVINVEVWDNAYNISEENLFAIEIGEEAVEPYIYLNEPDLLSIYKAKQIRFDGYVVKKGGLESVTINGEEATVYFDENINAHRFDLTLELEDGYHEAKVKAVAADGLESQITRRFFVDSTPAELKVEVLERETHENRATLKLTMKDNFPLLTLYVDDSLEYKHDALDRFSKVEPVEETVEIEVLLDVGMNEIELELYDFAGNVTKETVKIYRELPPIGTHTVEIGDTLVPGFERNVDGTIVVGYDVVDEDGVIVDEDTLAALNAQVPGEGGTVGVGYTGFNVKFENENLKKVRVYKNNEELKVLDKESNVPLKVYAAIADKQDDDTWTARIGEETNWKFEWLDEDGKVIGRTFFTTKVVLGEAPEPIEVTRVNKVVRADSTGGESLVYDYADGVLTISAPIAEIPSVENPAGIEARWVGMRIPRPTDEVAGEGTIKLTIKEEGKEDVVHENVTYGEDDPFLYYFGALEGGRTQTLEIVWNGTHKETLVVKYVDTTKPEVDKTELATKIEEAEKLEERLYTEESWEIFAQALADAKTVFENEEATQAEVDQALAALTAAMEGLVRLVEEIITKIEGKYGTIEDGEKQIYVAYILFNIKEGFVETDEDVVVLIDGVELEMKDGKEDYDYRFEGMLDKAPESVIIKIGEKEYNVTELFIWNEDGELDESWIREIFNNLKNK